MKSIAYLALVCAAMVAGSAVARPEVPEGVQEISGQFGSPGHQLKNCAFWANEAAAAARYRDRGVKEQTAEDAVPLSEHATEQDADLAGRRREVIAQVYEDDDLQRMSPKNLHDAVFAFCKSDNQ